MKKCIAYSAIPGSREAWIPCMREAQAGYGLCPRHSDLVAGVLMGICVAGIAEDAKDKLKKLRRAETKRLAEHRRKSRACATGKARQLRTMEVSFDSDSYDLAVSEVAVRPQEFIGRHEQA